MRIRQLLIAKLLLASCVAVGCGPSPDAPAGTVPHAPASPVAAAVASSMPPSGAADGETSGVTSDQIVVGSCACLSGQMQERGRQVVSGGRLYFDSVNEQGGVNGRKVKLISADDEYNPEKAIDCFNGLLNDHIFLGTLFQGTAPATRYVPMSDLHKIPLIGFSTGAEFLEVPVHPYVFCIRASFFDEAQAQVDALWNRVGARRIAVVYQNDAYGASCLDGVRKALQKYGATPVAQVSYPRLTHDVDGLIDQVKSSNPQVVILGASADALPELVKRRAATHWDVEMVGFSTGTDLLVREAGRAADGVLISETYPLTNEALPAVVLYEKLLQKYAPGTEPSYSQFEGFLVANVVVEALKRSGRQLTRTGFVRSLESMQDFDAGLGPGAKISFSKTQHNGLHAVSFVVVRGGKPVTLTDWSQIHIPK